MGIKKEDKKPKLPPVFTGEAIEIRFPDVQMPNGKLQQFHIVTFPDYVHKVYVEDKMYSVLGRDLEIGMAFVVDGNYIPIIDIDKNYLYHGMMIQPIQIGVPCFVDEITRYKFKRLFKENGEQAWEISEIKDVTK